MTNWQRAGGAFVASAVIVLVVGRLVAIAEREETRKGDCVIAGGHIVHIYRDWLCLKDGKIVEVK